MGSGDVEAHRGEEPDFDTSAPGRAVEGPCAAECDHLVEAVSKGVNMRLEGSCHCRAVRFSVESHCPAPFMHCHCSICRKTAGSGGYAINLGADATTLTVSGQAHVAIYHAVLREPGRRVKRSPAGRDFCRECIGYGCRAEGRPV